MDIPVELSAAIDDELDGVSPRELKLAVERVSGRYRAESADPSGHVGDERDVQAYLAYRMPATYAATWSALCAAVDLLGAWQPRSILDVGAGTGAATWAALDIWPGIERATSLDHNLAMIAAGKRIAAASTHPALQTAEWLSGDIGSLPARQMYELVMSSYIYNEIPVVRRRDFLAELWQRAGQLLVLVDPGTPRAFEGLRDARTTLIKMGASIVAPCPHDRTCPMAHGDWCHFAARINRSRIQRVVKSAERSHEDEKFSYVVASRGPVRQAPSRVIRHPQIRKGQVSLELCTSAGLATRNYSRRKSGDVYRTARSLRWGDVWGEAGGRQFEREDPPSTLDLDI